MHSLVSVRLLLLLASLIVFGVSILLIQKNSHSRRGGDDFVRRKKLKTFGAILLFPAVLLLALAALHEEIAADSTMTIDPVAAAVAQDYTPPVLPRPTTTLLAPKDTWKTQMPGTNAVSYATAPSQPVTSPSGAAPFSLPPAFTPSATPAAAPTAAPAAVPPPLPASASPLTRAQQMQADLATASEAIASNPKNIDAYSTRGNLYAAKRDWAAAERDYRSALAIDPTNTKAKFNIAEMSFMQKKYDVAKTGFAALEQDSDIGDLAAYKAFLSDMFGGQMDAASAQLDAFNKVGGNASYFFANAAWSINHRKLDDARDWLRSASRIYPPAKVKLYATTLFEMGYLPLPQAPAN